MFPNPDAAVPDQPPNGESVEMKEEEAADETAPKTEGESLPVNKEEGGELPAAHEMEGQEEGGAPAQEMESEAPPPDTKDTEGEGKEGEKPAEPTTEQSAGKEGAGPVAISAPAMTKFLSLDKPLPRKRFLQVSGNLFFYSLSHGLPGPTSRFKSESQ